MQRFLALIVAMLVAFSMSGSSVTAQGTTAVLQVQVVGPPAAPCSGEEPYPYFHTTVNADGQMNGGSYWACDAVPIAVVFDGSTPECSGPRVPIGNAAVNYGCVNALLDHGPLGFCPVGVVGEQCTLWQAAIGDGNTNFLLPSESGECPVDGMVAKDFATDTAQGTICTS